MLVPTARSLAPEMATRHAPGAQVEIEVLEDGVGVRGGKLVRATKLRLVAPAEAALDESPATPQKPRAPAPAEGLAAAIGATKWSEIKITVVNGHTVRVQCGKISVRRSYIDLGFGGENRNPIDKWKYVMAICAGHGTFRWRQFGNYPAAKNAVAVVQKLLKTAFGLADNPFHRYKSAIGCRRSSRDLGDRRRQQLTRRQGNGRRSGRSARYEIRRRRRQSSR